MRETVDKGESRCFIFYFDGVSLSAQSQFELEFKDFFRKDIKLKPLRIPFGPVKIQRRRSA